MKKIILILAACILLFNCSSNEPEIQDPNLIVLQKIYDNSGGKGDATAITMEDLKTIGVENVEDTKLSQYQNAISAKTDFSNPPTVEELQAVVMNINNNNTCSYNTITLSDPLEYRAITKRELIGSWKLEAYVSISDCSIDLTPSNPITRSFEHLGAVTINFHEDNTFSGETVTNTYCGEYVLQGNKTSALTFGITKINEPEWINTFSLAMHYAEYITISNDKLIIRSDSQNTILIFTKICQVVNRDEALLNSPSAPFDIDSYEIMDDCLKIRIRYDGGCCGNADLSLIPVGSAETFPPLQIIKLIFDEHYLPFSDDDCDPKVTREFCFDIKPLRVSGGSSVSLETEDLGIKILYEY